MNSSIPSGPSSRPTPERSDAAKRQVCLRSTRLVDVHHAGLDLVANSPGPFGVGTEDAGAQPELSIVGQFHGFFLAGGAEDYRRWAEHFLDGRPPCPVLHL